MRRFIHGDHDGVLDHLRIAGDLVLAYSLRTNGDWRFVPDLIGQDVDLTKLLL